LDDDGKRGPLLPVPKFGTNGSDGKRGRYLRELGPVPGKTTPSDCRSRSERSGARRSI